MIPTERTTGVYHLGIPLENTTGKYDRQILLGILPRLLELFQSGFEWASMLSAVQIAVEYAADCGCVSGRRVSEYTRTQRY